LLLILNKKTVKINLDYNQSLTVSNLFL